MKFKYLSSDFLASYNSLLEELEEKQALLDTHYQEAVEKIVEAEKNRLDRLVPEIFKKGDRVKIRGHKSEGKIVSSFINFSVEVQDDLGTNSFGPARFYPISSAVDEEVVTCEGILRSYLVEKAPHAIESDWGIESVVSSHYEDELEKI